MTKGPWVSQALKGELERHVALAAPGRVAAVVTPGARTLYSSVIDELGSQISFHDRAEDVADAAVVAAVAESIASARQLYIDLQPLKRRGLPVVFCLPERRLATKAPNWEQSGLQYEGMFALAALYARTVG